MWFAGRNGGAAMGSRRTAQVAGLLRLRKGRAGVLRMENAFRGPLAPDYSDMVNPTVNRRHGTMSPRIDGAMSSQ